MLLFAKKSKIFNNLLNYHNYSKKKGFSSKSFNNVIIKKPSRNLSKNYDPAIVEEGWYEWWESKGFFSSNQEVDDPSKRFVMLAPPPNVTGNLHIGHALTLSIQDAIARWYRMSGYQVSWIPGTDHAGIATQSVVERKLYSENKITRHQLGKDEFIKEIWKWRELHGNQIIQQMKRLGSSLDWNNLYFTMDETRSQAVKKAFIKLYNDGLIYRDNRLVNWCCALETVISDIEELIVTTTRVETILGDIAIAIHPDDPRYKILHGKEVIHPLLNKRLPIIYDSELVNMEFGTGVVKVTPAHDRNDFLCAKRNKLPIINIFNKNGTLNDNCGITNFVGKDRFKVREIIIKMLEDQGYYRGKELNHEMRIARCSRSGDIIEPMLQPQWYIKCRDLATRALKDVKEGNIMIKPGHHIEEWNRWMENIQDWCVSRQLWWGHPIPVYHLTFYNQITGHHELQLAATSKAEAEKHFEKYLKEINIEALTYTLVQDEDVLDTWFSSALLPLTALHWAGDDKIPYNYPNSMIESGFDILFFWISRMTMLCTYFSGEPPFKQILLHSMGRKMSKSLGNVIDPLSVIEGITLKQMQESLHGSNLPKDELEKSIKLLSKEFPQGIKTCGTDSLRFSLISYTRQSRQINLDISNVIAIKSFCVKLWNLFKFSNDRFEKLNHSTEIQKKSPRLGVISLKEEYQQNLKLVDKYILSKLSKTIDICNNEFNNLKLCEVTDSIRSFIVDDLCGVYLEFIKPTLYGNREKVDERDQQVSLKVLEICLDSSLRLLHPLMPFITEELWQNLVIRNKNKGLAPESIMLVDYPNLRDFDICKDEQVEKEMKIILDVIHASRSLRQSSNLPLGQPLPFIIWTDDKFLSSDQGPIKKHLKEIKNFIKASEIRLIDNQNEDQDSTRINQMITPNLKVQISKSFIKKNAEQEKFG
ncbi:10855_t:CDS:10 [Entrophospora sp. SA101]|nr:10855_t:CDS:10 [Entrophospora sp. SA101]